MSAPRWLRRQLSGPSGFLARPMALLLNRINRTEYQRALVCLDAQRGETVLELGFGGGIGVRALLDAGVHVVASEPSVAMRARAHRRFNTALAEGRLEIWADTAESLHDRSIDRALTLNTVYFWKDIDRGFANLARMVKVRLVIGVGAPSHLVDVGFREEGFRVESIEWYAERLRAAGFQTRIEPGRDDGSGLLVGSPG